jgi:hypothetical protein
MLAQSRLPASRRRLLLIAVLVILGLGLAAFFGMRAYRAYHRFQQPQAGVTDVEALRGWMTLPYIAHTYDVPEDALFAALGIPKAGNETLSIRQLVAKYGRDPQATRQALLQALRDYQRTPAPTSGRAP